MEQNEKEQNEKGLGVILLLSIVATIIGIIAPVVQHGGVY